MKHTFLINWLGCTHPVLCCTCRPEYKDEEGQENEVIQESDSALLQLDDELDDDQLDSDDDGPVFLDLTGLKTGKETEVRYISNLESV